MPEALDRPAPFVVLNRVVNPLVRALLRSRAHGLLSSRLALVTLTGRRSGREFTVPVGYRRDGELVTITVGAPERKRWWRNLRGGAPVTLIVRGERRSGNADVHGDERSSVSVAVRLDPA